MYKLFLGFVFFKSSFSFGIFSWGKTKRKYSTYKSTTGMTVHGNGILIKWCFPYKTDIKCAEHLKVFIYYTVLSLNQIVNSIGNQKDLPYYCKPILMSGQMRSEIQSF